MTRIVAKDKFQKIIHKKKFNQCKHGKQTSKQENDDDYDDDDDDDDDKGNFLLWSNFFGFFSS